MLSGSGFSTNKRSLIILSAFHLCGKTGCSGGKSNGTGLSTGNFSEKGIALEVLPFSRFSR